MTGMVSEAVRESEAPNADAVELRDRSAILRATIPFSVLDEAHLDGVAQKVIPISHPKGEVIFREGEPAGQFFVVWTGQVKLTTYGPARRHRLVGIVGPNQIFGEPGIVDHGPRAMDAEAMEDCTLLGVGAETFWATVESSPPFARKVIELMGDRLRRADRAAQDLVFFDASTRLARKLVDLAEDHGEPVESGILIRARMTQKDLAQMTGMARPNVNRLLAAFTTQGWIDWNDGMPIILRADLLIEHAK
jgi:CRP/FNR family transcriptional regulator